MNREQQQLDVRNLELVAAKHLPVYCMVTVFLVLIAFMFTEARRDEPVSFHDFQ